MTLGTTKVSKAGGQIPDMCSLSFETGPCKGMFDRWSFNPATKTCQVKIKFKGLNVIHRIFGWYVTV